MADAVLQAAKPLPAPVAVVGHSLGGAVAIEMARNAPDVVSRLALIAPLGLGAGINEAFLKRFPDATTHAQAEDVLHLLVERPRLISAQMVAHVLAFLKSDRHREGLRRIAAEIMDFGTVELPGGCKPTLIWGENDRVNPLDRERLDALDLPLHVLPNTGHVPQTESVTRTNQILLDALAG